MKYFSTLSQTQKALCAILLSHVVVTVLCLPLLLWYGVLGVFLLPVGLEEIIRVLFGIEHEFSLFFAMGIYYLVFGVSLYYAKKDPMSIDFRILSHVYTVLLVCSVVGFINIVIHSI
jgi:hypothetical protein